MKTMPHVRFTPWVGDSYGDESAFGTPVMVLGESHYTEKDREPSSLTSDVMRLVIKGAKWNFYTRVLQTFVSKHPVDPRSFWHSVAFYNFIQIPIKKGSRPMKQMWLDAEQPFCEVLEWLDPRPRLIAVFGFRCWDKYALLRKGNQIDRSREAGGRMLRVWPC